MKPVMNLDEVVFDDIEDNGVYTSRRGTIGARIGAQKLGYNQTIVPPGKRQCPFQSHPNEEEMFFILDGEGTLRFGDQTLPLRKGDVVACPTGGPELAHQIVNTGSVELRYLSISTMSEIEICEYPDSNKMGVFARHLRKMFRAEADVDYYDREKVSE
jgi:uncharacterized cupin superfamily protein